MQAEDLRETTKDIEPVLGHYFQDYSLKPELLQGLKDKLWKRPSPIQEYAIPLILEGHSLIARAKNGTGKTGAFLLPTLQLVDTKLAYTQALILVPNKELTLQICGIAHQLGKHMGLRCESITGGDSYEADSQRLSKPVHLIAATPGRIMDLCNRRIADLDSCRLLVLDEADRLLDNLFYKSIERIIGMMGRPVQILLFSATFPREIKVFTDRYLANSKMINLMREHTLLGVTQYYIYLEDKEKMICLNHLLTILQIDQCIIFANSFKRVNYIFRKLSEKGVKCLQINGSMEKADRNDVYEAFTKGECKILVSTDVWARGIDIRSLNVVINFDFPDKSQTYLHRIGRSGRFGHRGLAVNLIVERDQNTLLRVEKELDVEIEQMPKDPPDPKLYCG